MFYMIGTYYDYDVNQMRERLAGFRLLDTGTGEVKDIPYKAVVKALTRKAVEIENLRINRGILETHNGSIKRYARVTYYGYIENNQAVVILWKDGNNVFTCSDIRGIIYRLPEKELVRIHGERGTIANGRVVNGRVYAIEGSYPVIRTAECEKSSIINEYRKKCAVLGIRPLIIKEEKDGIVVVGADPTDTKVLIPQFVTKIANRAFANHDNLESVAIGDNVRNIGDEAFEGCSRLVDVKLPREIDKLGHSVFAKCRRLKRVELPRNILEVPRSTFEYCSSLKEVEIPEKVIKISNRAFLKCSDIETVKLPKGIKEISKNAFEDCDKLRNINLEEGIDRKSVV